MAIENKYYYTSFTNYSYSSRRNQPQLVKWNKRYYIEIDEGVDYHQYFSISVSKMRGEHFDKPKSSEYEKVKPVMEEIFSDHYNLGLRNIARTEIEDGEFYLTKKGKDWFVVEYYSTDEKQKKSLRIDLRDSSEDLWLMVHNGSGHSGRPGSRKNADPIPVEKFKQFLNLTLKFLSDQDSFLLYIDPYLKNFYNLATGGEIIESFDVQNRKLIISDLALSYNSTI